MSISLKTMTFDEDVLSILREIHWKDDGLLGVLEQQLDRKLYLKTNKALEALGGKWNRKAAGHVFREDPRFLIPGLLESGELVVERDGFFETPAEIVAKMINRVKPEGKILEPSAGLGAIANNLGVPHAQVSCVERNEQRARILRQNGYRVHCGDFLEYDGKNFNTCFMNPPFKGGQDIEHVRHAYDLLRDGGAMVSIMSEGPFFRGDKKAIAFREWLEKVGGQSETLPRGAFKESGTMANTRIVVIRKQTRHRKWEDKADVNLT